MSRTMLPVADRAAVRAYAREVGRLHRTSLVSVVVLASLTTIAGLFGPRLLGDIVQAVQAGTSGAHLNVLAVALVSAICVQSVLNHYAYLAGKKFGEKLVHADDYSDAVFAARRYAE